MTTEMREPRSEVEPCHAAEEDGRDGLGSARPDRPSADDRVVVRWHPTKRQLAIVGGIAALVVMGSAALVFDIGAGSLGLFAMILVCPLLHILMMRGMGHGGQGGCHDGSQSTTRSSSERKSDKG